MSGMDKVYLKNRNVDEIKYEHPVLKEILEESNNVYCFQEQIMLLANKLGKIPEHECDILRKVISKKPEPGSESEKKAFALESKFIKGSTENGLSTPRSKEIFDDFKKFLSRRCHPKSKVRIPKPFAGFIKCGECGMTITAEIQKGYLYYRCTKKSKVHDCSQPFIREEKLLEQVNSVISQVSLRTDWGEHMLAKLKTERDNISQSVMVASKELKEKVILINKKISFLLDSFVDQTLSREDYLLKKSQLVSEKKSLEEKIIELSRRPFDWLEQMRNWIIFALEADKIASDNKNHFQKIKNNF